jgi:MFS family permease
MNAGSGEPREGRANTSGGAGLRSAGVTRSDLRKCTIDGVVYSVMVGVGETYLAAFAISLGMSDVVAGLVASVPVAAGALLQLMVPAGVRWMGSQRRWVLLCAATQATSFIPLVVGALIGRMPVAVLFLMATLYWAAAISAGPAWNTWVGTFVPRRVRAHYFGFRWRVCNMGTVLGLSIAGLTLYLSAPGAGAPDVTWPPRAFAVLFVIAAACRYSCIPFLATTSEPNPIPERARVVPPRELLGRLRHGNDGRLLLFMVCMTAGVQVAQPFLNPYLLTQVHLPDLGYPALLGAAFLGKILSPPMFGRFARRFGASRLLWLGGLGLIPLSALWIVSDSFWYLLAAQFVSGTMWAAYELATFLLLFETIHERERTSVLTTFNVCNYAAMFAGSALGGLLLRQLGEDHSAYMVLFAASLGARALTVFLLVRIVPVNLPHPVRIATTSLAVRPNEGSIDEPVLESIAGENPPAQAGERPGGERAGR